VVEKIWEKVVDFPEFPGLLKGEYKEKSGCFSLRECFGKFYPKHHYVV